MLRNRTVREGLSIIQAFNDVGMQSENNAFIAISPVVVHQAAETKGTKKKKTGESEIYSVASVSNTPRQEIIFKVSIHLS